MSKVEIRIDHRGMGTVKVDGVDISDKTRALDISQEVGRMPRVTLELVALGLDVELEDAEIATRILRPEPRMGDGPRKSQETCGHHGDRADAGTSDAPLGFICLECGKYVSEP